MGVVSAVFLVLVTILCKYPRSASEAPSSHLAVPPVGVWAVAGCGMDLFINICLTILGYIPGKLSFSPCTWFLGLTRVGHIHAFYLEYVYFDRREQAREGRFASASAPGVYSDNVQSGGGGYGTIVHST